jgi:hypothetical protein
MLVGGHGRYDTAEYGVVGNMKHDGRSKGVKGDMTD